MPYLKVTAAAALLVLTGNVPALSQAAIQEPGLASFYHPERDVTAGRYAGYSGSFYSAHAYIDTVPPLQVRPAARYQGQARRRQ